MNETNHPARRLRHGDRPTEPLTFEDAAANKAAEEGKLPNGGMHDSIFVKVWGDAGGGDSGRRALANYAFELGRASRQVANKAEVEQVQIADVDHFVKSSIRDFADFREDVERLSTTAHRATLKHIRKAIYDTIDARVRNSVIAALASRATPPATTGASTVLTDERRDELARAVNLDGSMLVGKRCDYWRAYARAIEREVAAQAGQVAVPDFRNVTEVKRTSDQSLTITFASCASCSKFERAAAPSPAKESK